MSRLLALFQSTHDVIKAERLCIRQGIPCKVIAAPREITSECGLAIEVAEERREAIEALLSANAVIFSWRRLP